MDNSTLILGAIGAVVLLIIVWRFGKALAKLALALGALAAVIVIGLAFLTQASANRQTAQAATIATTGHTMISAATSIIIFLLMIILGTGLTSAGVIIGWHWYQGYRKRRQLQDTLYQAQIYALLNGARMPAGPRQPTLPQQGNILVFPGGHPNSPGLTLEDLAQALAGLQDRPDPLAGLLPPDNDSGGWEIPE